MAAIIIREATEDDLAEVLALYAEIEDAGGPILSVEQARPIFARLKSYPDYKLYIALDGERAVGTFALLVMDNLAHMGARSGVVEDVVVHPATQGQGVGRLMMDFARQRCHEAGCYKLALSSNLKREAAHRFYDSLGFERHGYSFRVDTAEL